MGAEYLTAATVFLNKAQEDRKTFPYPEVVFKARELLMGLHPGYFISGADNGLISFYWASSLGEKRWAKLDIGSFRYSFMASRGDNQPVWTETGFTWNLGKVLAPLNCIVDCSINNPEDFLV